MSSPLGGGCIDTPDAQYLFWARGCFTYAFNADLFSRIARGGSGEDAEPFVRGAFNASFEAWTDVSCGDRKPFFAEQAASVTQTSATVFEWDAVNESVIAMRTPEQWASEADHDPRAVALTLLWFSKKTGEIMDFDMELNGGKGPFADCTDGCRPGMLDLQNTITHEAGHVYGLAHSLVPHATMQATTGLAAETDKRILKDDDKAGYCALDLPEFSCDAAPCSCPPPPEYHRSNSGGCGCRVSEAARSRGAPGGGMLLMTGVTLWARKRRGRGTQR